MVLDEPTLTSLAAKVESLSASLAEVKASDAKSEAELNTFYLMWAGALIFLMQAGFATLSAGSIRAKNVKNILLKNLLDACIGAFAWYLLGYGFAYHKDTDADANAFIGTGPSHFALSGHKDWDGSDNKGYDWIMWFFQYAFCAAAATIVSGAVAERCQLMAYLVYSFCISGFVYPVVVHWVWDPAGFLSAFNKNHIIAGVIDFAGSGVVHMTGGFAALVGAKILGPRTGRFERPADFDGHSTPLQLIGTFLLWFGWYGFNPGSTLVIHGYAHHMARAAVTTTLSAAMGGLVGLLVKRLMPKKLGGSGLYDIGHTCNSLLGALVGITAGCATVHPWAAIIIGTISAFVYHGASCMMRQLRIDDPLDAFAVHGACGLWGVLATGLFTAKEYSYAPHADSDLYKELDGNNETYGYDSGLFMEGTRGLLFGTHVVAVIIEIAWVVTMSAIMFGVLKAAGIFRVPPEDEDMGLDNSKHGGSAYTHDVQMSNAEMTQLHSAAGGKKALVSHA